MKDCVLGANDSGRVVSGGRPHFLFVDLFKIEDIQGPNGSIPSPFVTVEFGGCKLTSVVAERTKTFTFSDRFRIPVCTPIDEDSITIRVWDQTTKAAIPTETTTGMSFLIGFQGPGAVQKTSATLLMSGELSFSDLLIKPQSARWFEFFGKDPLEHGRSFKGPCPPSHYLGRVLIAARAEALDDPDDLLAAQVLTAKSVDEPATRMAKIFADIFEVSGLEAAVEVCVRVQCMSIVQETMRVKKAKGAATFSFSEKHGRAPDIDATIPEETSQQPDVRLYVLATFVEGVELKVIAYTVLKLKDIALHNVAAPSQPIWVNMRPVGGVPQDLSCLLLVAVDQAPFGPHVRGIPGIEGGILPARGRRKPLVTLPHEVRVYAFSARNLIHPKRITPSPYVRVSCGGSQVASVTVKNSSDPIFMECLTIKTDLLCDPQTKIPTPEPVILQLVDSKLFDGEEQMIGRVALPFDRVQGKLSKTGGAKDFQMVRQEPKWIELKGGQGKMANVKRGDVLVCVDVLPEAEAVKIPPQPLWPTLRKCSLHFSLLGLRDLIRKDEVAIEGQLDGGKLKSSTGPGILDFAEVATGTSGQNVNLFPDDPRKKVKKPVIVISVTAYSEAASRGKATGEQQMTISLDDGSKAGGSASKPCQGITWQSVAGACYDFVKVRRMNVYLPENPVFDPKLTIEVYEAEVNEARLLGSCSMSMAKLLPWVLNRALAEAAIEARPAPKLVSFNGQLTTAENITNEEIDADSTAVAKLKKAEGLGRETRAERLRRRNMGFRAEISIQEEYNRMFKNCAVGPDGIPKSFQTPIEVFETMGPMIKKHVSTDAEELNVVVPYKHIMQAEGDIDSALDRQANGRRGKKRATIRGSLEEELVDVLLKKIQIRKGSSESDENDLKLCTGYILCQFALTYNDLTDPCIIDLCKPWVITPEKEKTTENTENKFIDQFRGSKSPQGGLRIRVYCLRAVGLSVRDVLSGTSDPFLALSFGRITETLRSSAKEKTLQPTFLKCIEKDLQFPQQSRLEVAVWDKNDLAADVPIGSTIIDLEERIFAPSYVRQLKAGAVPTELKPIRLNPNLLSGISGGEAFDTSTTTGTMELWVEVMDKITASEVPRTQLEEPQPAQAEIRVVVWSGRSFPLPEEGQPGLSVRFDCQIDCATFDEHASDSQFLMQSTDVHHNCEDGDLKYQWRCVWNKILLPTPSCVLQLTAYNHATLGPSTYLGETNIDLSRHLDALAKTLQPQYLEGEARVTKARLFGGDTAMGKAEGSVEFVGWVKVSVQMMTQKEADGRKVGLARFEPNRDPRLIKPAEGRQWGDLVTVSGLLPDFGYYMLVARLTVVLICIGLIILFLTIYPALLFQPKN